MDARNKEAGRVTEEKAEGFVSNYLLYLLAAASQVASEDFHTKVRERGLRVPEWRVLACLFDTDGQMVTHLAQLALMEQSRLTKIIDQMATKGLVSRRSDARDRRRVRVYLTEEGRGIAAELVRAARAHEASIVERLPEGETALLKDALRRIKALYGPVAPGLSGGNGEG